jgi:hypothetical protein
MIYAVTPNGIGNRVGFRLISPGDALESGETFTVDLDPAEDLSQYVLDVGGASLRFKDGSERLDEAKEQYLQLVRDRRDLMVGPDGELRVLFTNGHYYNANERSQMHALAYAVAGQAGLLTEFAWHDSFGERTVLSYEENMHLGLFMMQSAQAWWEVAGDAMRRIKAALSEGQVEAEYKNTTWPG